MSLIFSIIKEYDLVSIKKKLMVLYILNVMDIIFTLLLISTGIFIEVNYIMSIVINNRQFLSILIKVTIPLVLFIWVFYRMKKASTKQLYQSNIIITGGLIFYGLINASHIIWCIVYILI